MPAFGLFRATLWPLRPSALSCARGALSRRVWTPGPPPGSGAAGGSGDDEAEARKFVEARGYSADVARGVVESLRAPEWGGASPLALVTRMAGAWEVGDDAGLRALAMAVGREQAERSGKRLVQFEVKPARGAAPFVVAGYEGMSLKDVAEQGGFEGAASLADCLECACSGVMACSTCQVYVGAEWMQAVGPPSEAEMDMLDLAHEPRENSRLGCQLVLREELDGMQVSIPDGTHNLFDGEMLG